MKLFERASNKLFLTEAGKVVYEQVIPILAAREEMLTRLDGLRGSPRSRLALGANTTGGMYIVPAIVRAFGLSNPDVIPVPDEPPILNIGLFNILFITVLLRS